MYSLPGLLTSHTLFRRLGSLQRTALGKEILFRASVIVLNWNRAASLRDVCMDEFKKHRDSFTLDRHPVLFFSQNLIEVVGSLTTVLGQLKIVQNKAVLLIGHVQDLRNLPSSMGGCMGGKSNRNSKGKRENIRSRGFNPEVASLLEEYWAEFGSTLADYRDLEQHFYAMANQAVMHFEPHVSLRVILPDDPAAKGSSANATFTKSVDAFRLLWESFRSLEQTLDRCLGVLGVPEQSLLRVPIGVNPKVLNEPVPLSRAQTLAVVIGGGMAKGDIAAQVRFTSESTLVLERVDKREGE